MADERREWMQRGVNQLLFSYTPERVVNWENGAMIVKLAAVRLTEPWEDARAAVVLAEVSEYLGRWRERAGVVDPRFADPMEDSERFVIGQPAAVDAVLLRTALRCTACHAVVFPGDKRTGSSRRVCPNCSRPTLQQYGQVFVHGCGSLVTLQRWMPGVSRTTGRWEPHNYQLRCPKCSDGGVPGLPGRTDRIRDTRVICLRCRAQIRERLVARCHRCLEAMPPEERISRRLTSPNGAIGADEEDGEAGGSVLARILMRATNFQASEAYYPHTLSILRLDRPPVVTSVDPHAEILRRLLPEGSRPKMADVHHRIAELNQLAQEALRAGRRAEYQQKLMEIASVASRPEPPAPPAPSRQGDLITLALDLEHAIEDSLAFLTSVRSRHAAAIIREEGGATALLGEQVDDLQRRLGLRDIWVVDDLPVIAAAFGWTRRTFEPTYEERGARLPTHLHPFPSLDQAAARRLGRMDLTGRIPILAREGEYEGLYLGLDPDLVAAWVEANGVSLVSEGEHSLVRILRSLEPVSKYYDEVWSLPVRRLVFGLIHTLSHVAMRSVSRYAGVERTSLGEYVFLPLLGTAVYTGGLSFNMGNVDTMVRTHLHAFLVDLADESMACPVDPECLDGRGACAMCIHSPEISCRVFNHGVSRALLLGGQAPWQAPGQRLTGFWEVVMGFEQRL